MTQLPPQALANQIARSRRWYHLLLAIVNTTAGLAIISGIDPFSVESIAWGQTAPAPAAPAAPTIPGSTPQQDQVRAQAEEAYQAGNYSVAIELATQLIAANPKDHIAYYLRASSRVEQGQAIRDVKMVRGGVEDSREAMRHGGTSMVNYYLPYMLGMTTLSQIENRRDHVDTVLKVAEQLLAKSNLPADDRANILYQRASAYAFLKQTDSSLADYRAALALQPQHVGAHVALADALVAAQRYPEAEAAFSDAVQAFPTNPLVFNNRGMYFQQRGKIPEALADFTKAVEVDPGYFVAWTNRGFANITSGQSSAAEADLTKSLAANPNQPLAYSLRATARLSKGDSKGAIADYEQVLKFDPKNPVAHHDVGFARFFQREFREALVEFNQAVTIDPRLKYLHPWRYWTMTLLGDKDPAEQLAGEHAAKPAEQREWNDWLVLFLAGKVNEQELVNAVAINDPARKNLQLCEAYFFIGERRLLGGDREGSANSYKESLNTKATQLSAYRGSQYQIKMFNP